MNLQYISVLLRLIRLPNLVIIALVLYLQRWCIVIPGMQQNGTSVFWTGYAWIVLGTILLAAGGYIINDYFDKEIDAVNRPGKTLSLKLIRPGILVMSYIIITLAGLASIGWACFLVGTFILWPVYLFAAVILFWYSYQLKKVLILGNIAVSLSSAFTMPAALLYDLLSPVGLSITGFSEEHIYSGVLVRVIIYSIFAFLISFAREIIKDIEDIDGDLSYGCRSLPIVYGVSPAKGIIVTSLGLILVLLCFWQVDLAAEDHAEIALYLAIAVQLPVIWLSIYVIRMHTKIQYHLAGLIAKIIMVTGILSMLWFIF